MNRFFNTALAHASLLKNKYARITVLLANVLIKLGRTDWHRWNAGYLKERTATLVRMVKAFITGRYTVIPWKTVATLLAALIYFLNPFDLVPDILPGIGLGDDFAVLMGVYQSLSSEIEKFLAWESLQPART